MPRIKPGATWCEARMLIIVLLGTPRPHHHHFFLKCDISEATSRIKKKYTEYFFYWLIETSVSLRKACRGHCNQ